MNDDTKKGCLIVVIFLLVVVFGPIFFVLEILATAPTEAKIFMMVWVLFVIVCSAFITDNATRITICIIPTVIFAFAYVA